jgi:hypothetical protein
VKLSVLSKATANMPSQYRAMIAAANASFRVAVAAVRQVSLFYVRKLAN